MDFDVLVQRSEDAIGKVDDTWLPRVQRTFSQISDLIERQSVKLRTTGPTEIQSASLLLAREGVDPTLLLAAELKGLGPGVPEGPGRIESSVEAYLGRAHEALMLGCIRAAEEEATEKFDLCLERLREAEWARAKRDVLPQLGRGRLNAKVLSDAATSARAPAPATPAAPSRLSQRKEAYAAAVEALNTDLAKNPDAEPRAVLRFRDCLPPPSPSESGQTTARSCWELLASMAEEAYKTDPNDPPARRTALVRGARRYLEAEHASFMERVCARNPAVAAVGGEHSRIKWVKGFLRVKEGQRDRGAGDSFWHTIFYCLRSGYVDQAIQEAGGRDASLQLYLMDWRERGGALSPSHGPEVEAELERAHAELAGAGGGRGSAQVFRMAVLVVLSGSKMWHDTFLRGVMDLPAFLSTMEDFLWFKLAIIREPPTSAPRPPASFPPLSGPSGPAAGFGFGAPSAAAAAAGAEGRYTIADLQNYLNSYKREHYTKGGKEPLLYVLVLIMSLQFKSLIPLVTSDFDDPLVALDLLHVCVALAADDLLDATCNIPGHVAPQPGPPETAARLSLQISQSLRMYGAELQQSSESIERGVMWALNYYAMVVRLTPEAPQQGEPGRAQVTRELLRELLKDTQVYGLLLQGPGPDGPPGLGASPLSRLEPSPHELHSQLVAVAEEFASGSEYYKALRIYLHEREEGRALTLVNLELVRLLNEPGLVTRVLSDFQHYVDIGRDCLDRLRAQRSDVITKEVMTRFTQLQRIRDAIIYDRKRQTKQVLQTLEEVGFLREGGLVPDAPPVQFLVDSLPRVAVIAARCTYDELVQAQGSERERLRAQLSSILGSASRWTLPTEVVRELDVIRLQAQQVIGA